ncbi:hypothetical protein M9Y10_021645 [Tritrichomonas musculus]|uniref:Initiator binding domain-containing protein n=1 Tax=Tritrichomonas musculus TaxID=1915356 RepID=A0ABR2KPZ6_9EUKA
MDILELKQNITEQGRKMKQTHLIWICLKKVDENKELFLSIGIGWVNDYQFLFNSTVFGVFSNRPINTLNHNFESHGFHYQKLNCKLKKKVCEIYSLTDLPNQKGWVLRWCEGFTRFTNEKEALKWKYYDLKKKMKKKIKEISSDKEKVLEVDSIMNFKNDDVINNDYAIKDEFFVSCPKQLQSYTSIEFNNDYIINENPDVFMSIDRPVQYSSFYNEFC